MPKLEIEIGDDGKIGTLPAELQTFFDKRIGEAVGKAKAAAAEEAARQSADPVLRERLKALELETSQLKEAEALRTKNFDAAQQQRDERHAKTLAEKDDTIAKSQAAIDKRTTRIRELVKNELGIVAAKAGARAESIEEIKELLDKHIALDDGFQPFVQDLAKPGNPRLDKDQKPVSLEGLVTTYLTDHPHHKAAGTSRTGLARTGASLTQSLASAKPGHDTLEAHRADIRSRQTNDALSSRG